MDGMTTSYLAIFGGFALFLLAMPKMIDILGGITRKIIQWQAEIQVARIRSKNAVDYVRGMIDAGKKAQEQEVESHVREGLIQSVVSCSDCGIVMDKHGQTYKCSNCGASSGVS